MTEKTISGVHVHVSPGSVETLVMRGGIINHHWIAHCLSNIFAKNYENWLMCVEVILCNISVVFLRHRVFMILLQLAKYIWLLCNKPIISESSLVSKVMSPKWETSG